MISNKQGLAQKQSQQQRLSPQQLQFVKLLQLPLADLSQRVMEEIESNPVLEFQDEQNRPSETNSDSESQDLDVSDADDRSAVDNIEINWEQLYARDDDDAWNTGRSQRIERHAEIPQSYVESPLERLERQISLLDLNDKQRIIADQIVGSLDVDGYFRRELSGVADSIAFNNGLPVKESEVLDVLNQIQKLDPPGVAARDLQECLLLQLDGLPKHTRGRDDAITILKTKWELFEKKHFDKIAAQLHLADERVIDAYHCIQSLDPKPGKISDPIGSDVTVKPDVIVEPVDDAMNRGDADALVGDLAILMTKENSPHLVISPYYVAMLHKLKSSGLSDRDQKQAETFIKQKIESAQVFLDSLKQRGDVLLMVVTEIVRRQESFFRSEGSLRPLIMKEIAEACDIDISTVSRIVNGKFVQTQHGTYELRSFFNEGIDTTDGDEVTNREVRAILSQIIHGEDKKKPFSDQALTEELNRRGYSVARRTVTKYREAVGLPVARLRRQVV